ncbi:MAG TPA: metallopeptidase family protein [Hyphomicrobium sp.]|nr:metallopeptidase family protein [Hyphomicrobium sp.]
MTSDWKDKRAPSLADFEMLAASAWEKLPATFRQLAGDVLIRIEDFATDDVLEELGIEDPFELTGLYQGVSLNKKSVLDIPREPDMVFLYRRPILDEWAAGEEELGHLIAHVLIHEIGHHFGFSDDDMLDIETESST